MAGDPKGAADFLAEGDWNAICYRCGCKAKASTMKKQWQGYWVCAKHWEPRQPQDFVRGIPDNMAPPWTQPPPADSFVGVCTVQGISSVVDYAVVDCSLVNAPYRGGT